MDIEKVVKSLQDVLSEHEELRGHRVDVEVIWAKDSSTHINFPVPEAKTAKPESDQEALYISAMQMLHDQMGLLQDKSIEQGIQADEAAKMSEAMCNLASTLRWMAEERRHWAQKENCGCTLSGGGGGNG